MYTFGHILNCFKHSLKLPLLLIFLLFHNLCLPKRNFSSFGRFQFLLLIINSLLTFNFLSCWSLNNFFFLIHSFLNYFFFILGVFNDDFSFSFLLLFNNLFIFHI